MSSNYLDWIKENGNPGADRLMFGVVPAYPIFMFAGIILVIIASVIKFRQKGIPLKEFEWAILIVVPIGIIGASFFGKIFLPGIIWYHAFFFWEPGMSLFGSLALGTVAGFVWFYKRSKTTLISVWVYADCIIPNILLGQVLGRWGNFYNHEILGQVVSDESLSWLPSAIKARLFYFPDLTGFGLGDGWWTNLSENLSKVATDGPFKGISLNDVLSWNKDQWLVNSAGLALDPALYNYGMILYRAPLFLIEGIGNFVLWVLITFVIANLGRWFSQPKPWDLQPKAYPGWYNQKYHSLPEKEILPVSTQIPVKYKKIIIKNDHGEKVELKLGFFKAWNKAYYWYDPSQTKTHEFEIKQLEWEKLTADNLKKLKKMKNDYHYQAKKIKNSQRLAKNQQTAELAKNRENYLVKRQEIYNLVGDWTRGLQGNPHGRDLEKLNNPNQFFVIRCGVLTGAYVIGYLILRIILETQRTVTELMIPGALVADFIILGLILLVGVWIVLITQFVAPYRYREVGWLYEKSY